MRSFPVRARGTSWRRGRAPPGVRRPAGAGASLRKGNRSCPEGSPFFPSLFLCLFLFFSFFSLLLFAFFPISLFSFVFFLFQGVVFKIDLFILTTCFPSIWTSRCVSMEDLDTFELASCRRQRKHTKKAHQESTKRKRFRGKPLRPMEIPCKDNFLGIFLHTPTDIHETREHLSKSTRIIAVAQNQPLAATDTRGGDVGIQLRGPHAGIKS